MKLEGINIMNILRLIQKHTFHLKKRVIHDRALFTSKFNRVFSFVTYLHNEMLKQVTDIWIFITSAFKQMKLQSQRLTC